MFDTVSTHTPRSPAIPASLALVTAEPRQPALAATRARRDVAADLWPTLLGVGVGDEEYKALRREAKDRRDLRLALESGGQTLFEFLCHLNPEGYHLTWRTGSDSWLWSALQAVQVQLAARAAQRKAVTPAAHALEIDMDEAALAC